MSYLKKLWIKLVELFKQGLSPKQLAISLVVSTLVSIFPIIGVSTIVLTCIAIPFRLNLPIMIAMSYILSPLQILLFIPFINLGAYVFNTEHTLLTFEAIKASYDASFLGRLTSEEISTNLLSRYAKMASS
jgi:uncharacterized protein (DUF2062 family)